MNENAETIDNTGEIEDIDTSDIDIDIASLSNEELTKMREELENPDSKEASDDGEEDDDNNEEEEKSEASEEQKQEEGEEVKEEKKTQEQKPSEEKKAAPSQEDEKAQLEKMRKQMEGQELLVKRKLSEIGAMKKQLQDSITEIKGKLSDDALLENPNEAVDNKLKLKDLQEQEEELGQAEMAIVKQFEAAKTVASHVKPNQWIVTGKQSIIR